MKEQAASNKVVTVFLVSREDSIWQATAAPVTLMAMTGGCDAPVCSSPARSVVALVAWLALSFSAAAVGSLFMPGDWYAALRKPSWNPPNWIFGPVWTALYTLMAVAAWLVWRRGGFAGHRVALCLFLAQLSFNALWSPLFFGLRHPALAFGDILLLWLTLFATTIAFWKARPLAGMLLSPYLAWVTFATALNFALWMLNR